MQWPLYGLNTLLDAIFVGQFVGETAFAGVYLVYPLAQITTEIRPLIGVSV
jgi:Na+-driven multidrug efflux pump